MASDRARRALEIRAEAAQLAAQFNEPQQSNGEESSLPNLIGNFTKGMRHLDNGIIANVDDYYAFVSAADSADPDEIAQLSLGPERINGIPQWRSKLANTANNGSYCEVRGWESMGAGQAFSLIGPDPQAVAMPPAPLTNSPEAISELGELYLMALARDIPFADWYKSKKIEKYADLLNQLTWFANPSADAGTDAENRRRRGLFTPDTVFRGILPGSKVGPYLSQFLIIGSKQIGDVNGEDEDRSLIRYGAITIDQRVRIAKEKIDYLTDVPTFLDAQDGANLRGLGQYQKGKRLMRSLRDLATYVHFDALYEAYLNACLILLANGAPLGDEIPFTRDDHIDKQEGFAQYGGPHILTLVTEVATRALKAVRYQKFNIHRRARPEAVAGCINTYKNSGQIDAVAPIADELDEILKLILKHNRTQNKKRTSDYDSDSDSSSDGDDEVEDSYLLPMAFQEGSPNHPSYGSGHATVAGACVTILKAFFKEDHQFFDEVYEVDNGDDYLKKVDLPDNVTLTVGSELEKLADNISIGRDAAGVHWFSDQWESLLLGEKVAIQMLIETKLTFPEEVHFNFTKFDGEKTRI